MRRIRAFRAFIKGAGVTAATGIVFSPVLAQSDWSLVCYSDPVDQLLRLHSSYKTPPSTPPVSPMERAELKAETCASCQSSLSCTDVLQAPLLAAPALPRYAPAAYSPLQQKLFQEATSLLSLSSLEERLQTDGWRLAASFSSAETEARIYVKAVETANKSELNRYVVIGTAEISAARYFSAITDLEQRTTWDTNAKQISVRPGERESEICVNWIGKMPWPLADRSYNFRSRLSSSDNQHCIVSMGSPDKTEVGETVPVRDYVSVSMVKDKDKDKDSSCQFATYYFDDPNLSTKKFPTWLESHLAKSLLPSFSRDVVKRALEISDQQAMGQVEQVRQRQAKEVRTTEDWSHVHHQTKRDPHHHTSAIDSGCG